MRICIVNGCDKKHSAKGYCVRHYDQMYKYGKILERTIKDSNEIVCKDDICKIVLYNIKCEEVARVIIDEEHRKKIENKKWSLNAGGYVVTMGIKKNKRLHHFILPVKEGFVTDHKDGDKLNNKKSNLRYATHSQNAMNSKKRKGYSWCKTKQRFKARIAADHKIVSLGSFRKEEDAIKARRKGELKYFKEFAANK